jgi:predicted nucleic acid-binding protein
MNNRSKKQYLLDTCTISELIKKTPQPKVIDWIAQCDERTLFISVLTLGEIHKGIAKLPNSKKRTQLETWVNTDFELRFAGRILTLTPKIARTWGILQGQLEQRGEKMPVIDGLIATTAIVHDLIVVTRNSADMQRSGVTIFNPWE